MIIGLVGFKQIGKSTAAAHLESVHNFKRHNFKDALVAEIKEGFPDLLEMMARQESLEIEELFQEKPPLMRALMQNFGTEVRRKQDRNYWVKQWVNKVASMKGNIVADDIRFKNEAACLKGQGGVIIRLTRPDVATGGSHSSEMEQLDIVADYTIDCVQGDHQGLYNKLDSVYEEIKASKV